MLKHMMIDAGELGQREDDDCQSRRFPSQGMRKAFGICSFVGHPRYLGRRGFASVNAAAVLADDARIPIAACFGMKILLNLPQRSRKPCARQMQSVVIPPRPSAAFVPTPWRSAVAPSPPAAESKTARKTACRGSACRRTP